MIGGAQPKLILGIDEDGKFTIDRQFAELIGLETERLWLLTKVDDTTFVKRCKEITWLEFNEDRTFKAKHDKPDVGLSLLMSPFSVSFTWQTTPITELIEARKNYYRFDTKNSKYLLVKLDESNLKEMAHSIEEVDEA